MSRVIVVEDTDIMRESLAESLGRAGYEVHTFAAAPDALQYLDGLPVDCMISDIRMPGMDGLELLTRVKGVDPDIPVIMMTAYGTVENAVTAMKEGAYDYILKPFQVDELEILVARAIEHRNLVRENQVLKAQLSTQTDDVLIGESAAFTEIHEHIQRVADHDVTLLIHGESGTGKEMVARAIHRMGARCTAPFLCVNCAALSAGLLESELFGHEKGSFTGAERTRKGRFELTEGGMLLLDEVTEMDLALQAKLLRVLQEKTYERVGSSTSRKADVRVIATTNRDLEQAVNEGVFRKDLYYRLNVYPIRIPPLRERKDDIPVLADHFLRKHAEHLGKTAPKMDDKAMDKLKGYAWPGNVRELENVITRVLICSEGNKITVKDLLMEDLAGPLAGGDDAMPVGTALEDVERRFIQATLDHFGGHQAKTAEALKIGVRTLRNKIKDGRLEVKKGA